MTNQTLEVIKNRRSVRAYATDQIKDEELNAIIEAGLYAPSAQNQQPWYFVALQNKELMNEISVKAKEAAKNVPNEMVQKLANNENYHVFFNAPTAILVFGKEDALFPAIDTAIALENILIAAESLNVASCWVSFPEFLFNYSEESKKYIEKLQVPEGYKLYYATSLGYKRTANTDKDIDPNVFSAAGYNKEQQVRRPKRKENSHHIVK